MQIVINVGGLASPIKKTTKAPKVQKQDDGFDEKAAALDLDLMMRDSDDEYTCMETEMKVLDWIKQNIKNKKKIRTFMEKAKHHIDPDLRTKIYDILRESKENK